MKLPQTIFGALTLVAMLAMPLYGQGEPNYDSQTPPEGTVIECPFYNAVAGKVAIVECTDLYAGVVITIPDARVTQGFLFCKRYVHSSSCPVWLPVRLAADQPPLDASKPLLCTVVGHIVTENLRFECSQ